MGFKKCPLVQIEETRKCMEAACTGQETDISDPTCPTTPWVAWSPCSASCGRGVRFRTRLLLVPPDQQVSCSGRVELLQHQPCVEQPDCTIDMMTAKRICMEAPEAGPCRGVHARWAFAAAKGMCVPFQYGGCRGNRNNFLTQEDCLNTCSVILGGGAGGAGGAGGLSVNSAAPVTSVSGPAQPQAGDCVVSAWSEWSRCSVSCGAGYQERTRTILSQPGPGGAACPPRLARRRRCTRLC